MSLSRRFHANSFLRAWQLYFDLMGPTMLRKLDSVTCARPSIGAVRGRRFTARDCPAGGDRRRGSNRRDHDATSLIIVVMTHRRSYSTNRMNNDTELLSAALSGFEQQRSEIEARIAELKREIAGRGGETRSNGTGSALIRKRTMSAAARKRISEATKKRWAAFRAKRAQRSAEPKVKTAGA